VLLRFGGRSNWAYSQIRRIAGSCYQNEAVTENNTIKQRMMHCSKRTGSNLSRCLYTGVMLKTSGDAGETRGMLWRREL